MVSCLLSLKGDINAPTDTETCGTLLKAAAHMGNDSVLDMLISHGCRLRAGRDIAKTDPVKAASLQNNVLVMEHLLARGCDPNGPKDLWGLTAVAIPCLFSTAAKHVELLCQHRAD